MKRLVAIYARQSVDKKDSVSIETQIDECRKEAGKHFKKYSDKGYSGKDTIRPELQLLLKDIESGSIEKVIVYKLDRISRNLVDFTNLYNLMESNNCNIISITERFDTSTPMGRAMMNILAVFAQMERENIMMRVKDNYAFRVKSGGWGGGSAPYGFENIKKNGVATLRPVKKQLQAVKYLFNTYAEDKNISIRSMQKHLIVKGFKTSGGKDFHYSAIRQILVSTIYCSADARLYKYLQSKRCIFLNDVKEYDGSCVAVLLRDMRVYLLKDVSGVIDSRTFITVQKRLDSNKALSRDIKSKNNLEELSGLIKCHNCGFALRIHKVPTITCSGKLQFRCDKSYKGLRLSVIQQNVNAEMQEYFKGLNEYQKKKSKALDKKRSKIAKLETQISNLIDVAANSKSASEAVAPKIAKLQDELYSLQLSINLGVNETDLLEYRIGLDKISGLDMKYLDYTKMDTETKQAVLRVLVNRILVNQDGSVKIDWKE